MFFDQPVDRGDALAFGRHLGQPLEAAGGPERLAFGFEAFEIEVGHLLRLAEV